MRETITLEIENSAEGYSGRLRLSSEVIELPELALGEEVKMLFEYGDDLRAQLAAGQYLYRQVFVPGYEESRAPTVDSILSLFEQLNPRDQLDTIMLRLEMPEKFQPPLSLSLDQREVKVVAWAGRSESGLQRLNDILTSAIDRRETAPRNLGRELRAREIGEVVLRIVTEDEHIARLPWMLLADEGIFLVNERWSVAVSGKAETRDIELPSSPRLLIFAPHPEGGPRIQAEAHVEELESLLSGANHWLRQGRNLKVAFDLEECVVLAADFAPEIVYYYGHGDGQSADDFARCLDNIRVPPYLVYINCCSGDAGAFLRTTKRLGNVVPAVIVSRAVASAEVARVQAMALWESLLLKAIEPHKAVASLYGKVGNLDLSTAATRRLMPVLHAHYGKWRSKPSNPPERREHDPYWHLKIDRVSQFSTVAMQTRQMLRECKPRSLAFAWYGREGEGIEVFHQRLNVELKEDLISTFVYEVRPDWPQDLDSPHRSFSDMLIEAFEVNELEDITARVRARTHGASGKQTLVYIRHQPVRSSKLINPKTLRLYLEWWSGVFVPLLENQQFALLGVSFVVKDPPKFQQFILERERLDELYLEGTIFRLLDEMDKLARRDLLDFLRTHNIRPSIERVDAALGNILEKTGGRYEATIEELKNLMDQIYPSEEGQEITQVPEGDDYDY